MSSSTAPRRRPSDGKGEAIPDPSSGRAVATMKVFDVPTDYRTFATDLPTEPSGNVRIAESKKKPGYYLMEGVRGYELYQTRHPMKERLLKIDGQTWMTDDPLHNEGMKALAEKSRGRVLVAGLGLGLVTDALLKNPEVESVTTVERNEQVIELVHPHFPSIVKERLTIEHEDFWKFVEITQEPYDTVICDLYVVSRAGRTDDQPYPPAIGRYFLQRAYPKSDVWVWGMRDPSANPAVEPVSGEYLEMVRAMREGQ